MDSRMVRQINEGKNIPDRIFWMDRRKAFSEVTDDRWMDVEKDGYADRT